MKNSLIIFLLSLFTVFTLNAQTLIAPAQNTDVEGGELKLMNSNSNYNPWYIDNYAGHLRFFESGIVKFQVTPTGDVRIPSGSLSIGTTSTLSKLQVEGRAAVGKSGVLNLDWTYETNWGGSAGKWAGYIGFNAYRNNDETKDNYFGRNKYTSKGVFEGSNYGFRWLFRKDNGYDSDGQHLLSEYMRLDNNGNLGIGTTNTKGFKLGVLGKIAAEEVKVATYANWSDFVFNKDYNLPTLKEVENHIKDKGHLQNIPSADDVKINGFFLAEMNAKLLQKIEELTLYTINQEKRIENLEDKNNQLNTQQEKIKVLEKQVALLLKSKK
ncbi:MAG: hypothetical protein ABJL44_19105 [Algibacter sp.]